MKPAPCSGTQAGGKKRRPRSRSQRPVSLSPREEEALFWAAEGKRSAEIAMIIDSRCRTVEKHIENIFKKLDVETRGAAAAFYYRRKIEQYKHELRRRNSQPVAHT